MTNSDSATAKKQHIEKFKGKFESIQGGCTVLINKTIQSINDVKMLGIYTYLSSQPPEWEISAQQLANHFNIGINKARKILTSLVDMGLLERIAIKEKGKFIKHEHNLYLKPLHGNREVEEIQSGIGSTEVIHKPLHENRETKTVKRKRCPNKTITSLENKEYKSIDNSSNPKPPTQTDFQELQWYLDRPQFKIPENLIWIKEWSHKENL